MNRPGPIAALAFAVAIATFTLSGCGGEPEKKPHDRRGPPGGMNLPTPAPSIHVQVSDAQGNAFDLSIECGAEASLQDCAKTNESILDHVARIHSGGSMQANRAGAGHRSNRGSDSNRDRP